MNQSLQQIYEQRYRKLSSALKTALAIWIFGLIVTLSVNSLPDDDSVMARIVKALGNFWTFCGLPFLVADLARNPAIKLQNAASPYFENYSYDPNFEAFRKFVAKFESISVNLKKQDHEHLAACLQEYETILYYDESRDDKKGLIANYAAYFKYIFEVLEEPVVQTKRDVSKTLIDDKAKLLIQLLETYPEQRQSLIQFAKKIAYYQFTSMQTEALPCLYLIGPSGVGKTTLIKELFAIFGVPLHYINASEPEVHYDKFYPSGKFEPSKSSSELQYLHAANTARYEGPIGLFYDELDKLVYQNEGLSGFISQSLLALTDMSRTKLPDFYTGINFPKQRFIIIIAVNKCILEEIYGLQRRVTVINFGPIALELKVTIAKKKMFEYARNAGLEVTPEIESTVERLAIANGLDGVGELTQDVKNLIEDLSQENFYADTILSDPKSAILTRYNSIKRAKPESDGSASDEIYPQAPEFAYPSVMTWL